MADGTDRAYSQNDLFLYKEDMLKIFRVTFLILACFLKGKIILLGKHY